jgi:hypothetical protein
MRHVDLSLLELKCRCCMNDWQRCSAVQDVQAYVWHQYAELQRCRGDIGGCGMHKRAALPLSA